MKAFAVVAVVIAGGSLALPATGSNTVELSVASTTAAATPPPSVSAAEFRVGPPEVVAGPHSKLDGLFNLVNVNGTFRGYIGNHDSMRYEGSSVEDLRLTGTFAINRGKLDEFDECGAWIKAVVVDPDQPGILRAWYHGEEQGPHPSGARCDYGQENERQTHKSIAYAQSTDGGITFTKPGYPDNQVVRISAPTLPTGEPGVAGEVTGRGDFSVVQSGSYWYLYYLDHEVEENIPGPGETKVTEQGAVARALISSNGLPGDWWNYNGNWETAITPGREGDAKPLGGPAMGSASRYVPANEFVRVRQPTKYGGVVMNYGSGSVGFTDQKLTEPLVYLGANDAYDRVDNPDGQRLLYSSIVGPSGSREWDSSFYLFYVYGLPRDNPNGWERRYLVRRRVTVDTRPASGPQTKLALATFQSNYPTSEVGTGESGDTWTTAGMVPGSHEYVGTTGYIMTAGAGDPSRSLLTDCLRQADGDHYLSVIGCDAPSEQWRDLGYIWKTAAPGTVELRQCQYPDGGDRFASAASTCTGPSTYAGSLGWVYPAVGDEGAATLRVDNAQEMYSGHQSYQRWSYVLPSDDVATEDPATEFAYNAITNEWEGPGSEKDVAAIRPATMNPGNEISGARRWQADATARLQINSTLGDGNVSCGNGVWAKIVHRSANPDLDDVELFSRSLGNGFSGVKANASVVVEQGDLIDFVLQPKGDGDCDRTNWNPSITVYP